ncbi:hypothetical protein F5Y16DRAFT_246680 [Xylariaceae sp. FL0255]|nr:hypothetical protein F5Y16DRAFT_246680 [Xylariaceae sp. FL0255]
MSTNALSLLGWMFLPSLVSGWVQSIYYGLTIRAGDPRPPPQSARFQQHRRRIHTLVIVIYLLYTIYEADWELRRAGTFYGDLGVPFGASERDIKSRFRRLAALHHPDKVSHNDGGAGAGNGGGGVGSGSESFFIHLKLASDTLTDAAKRFAYERFGADVTTNGWRNCASVKDYVVQGLQTQVLPHYAVAAAGLYGLGFLGYLETGRYWRWVSLVVLCAFEAHAVTRPKFPFVIESIVNPLITRLSPGHPPYLPFQAVALARRIIITIYIAIGQLGPIWQAQQAREAAAGQEALAKGLERLEATVKSLDVDATRLMDLEMAPFVNDPEVVRDLRSKLKEWLVQNTIRADPMVRDALGRSLQKRRVDAPAGARGTR